MSLSHREPFDDPFNAEEVVSRIISSMHDTVDYLTRALLFHMTFEEPNLLRSSQDVELRSEGTSIEAVVSAVEGEQVLQDCR